MTIRFPPRTFVQSVTLVVAGVAALVPGSGRALGATDTPALCRDDGDADEVLCRESGGGRRAGDHGSVGVGRAAVGIRAARPEHGLHDHGAAAGRWNRRADGEEERVDGGRRVDVQRVMEVRNDVTGDGAGSGAGVAVRNGVGSSERVGAAHNHEGRERGEREPRPQSRHQRSSIHGASERFAAKASPLMSRDFRNRRNERTEDATGRDSEPVDNRRRGGRRGDGIGELEPVLYQKDSEMGVVGIEARETGRARLGRIGWKGLLRDTIYAHGMRRLARN